MKKNWTDPPFPKPNKRTTKIAAEITDGRILLFKRYMTENFELRALEIGWSYAGSYCTIYCSYLVGCCPIFDLFGE